MSKFVVTIASDFGASTLTEHVRQALHKRQSNMLSSAPVTLMSKDGTLISVVDVELPDTSVSRDDFMGWVLETMRSQYGGPPFVVAVDDLDEDFKVNAGDPGIELSMRPA